MKRKKKKAMKANATKMSYFIFSTLWHTFLSHTMSRLGRDTRAHYQITITNENILFLTRIHTLFKDYFTIYIVKKPTTDLNRYCDKLLLLVGCKKLG